MRAVSIACHVHSDWSYDGKWSLGEIASAFAGRGSRVVMMTEHDRGFSSQKWSEYQAACAAASSEKVLLIPGMEYSDPENVVHVLVWGCADFLGENLPTAELLARVQEHGGIAVMAHPSRLNAWRQFDPAWTTNLLGIEAWNRKTDGWAPSRTASGLLAKNRCAHFVGLDFHDRRQFFPLSMRVSVNEVNAASVIDAMRNARAVPCVFGHPLGDVLNPLALAAFSTAERIRRPLARTVRKIIRRNASRHATVARRAT